MQNNSLGTYGEITPGAIAGYWETFGLKDVVNNIIGDLRVRDWDTKCNNLQHCNTQGFTEPIYRKERWGRVGLEMYSKWKPGIFVGILWDYTDHKIDPLNKENGGPDVVILVDMLESDYSKITNSQACKDYLEKLNQNHGDFDLIEYSKIPGYWRLVVLRKSLGDVLQGKQNRKVQEKALYDTFCEGINFLTKDGDLGRLNW